MDGDRAKAIAGALLVVTGTVLAVLGFFGVSATADRLTVITIYLAYLTFIFTVFLRHVGLLAPVFVPIYHLVIGLPRLVRTIAAVVILIAAVVGLVSVVVTVARGPVLPVSVVPRTIAGAEEGKPYLLQIVEPPVGRNQLQVRVDVSPVDGGKVGLCAAQASIEVTPVLDDVPRPSAAQTADNGDRVDLEIEGSFERAAIMAIVHSRAGCKVNFLVMEANYRG